MSISVRAMEEADRERLIALHAEAYQVPEYRLVRQRTLPIDQAYVITDRGRVMGGLRVERLGQFFGGRSVGSGVITAVKIAPEGRGRGLGRRLMAEVISLLREEGLALSALYPSSPGLYRSVGYEVAGSHVRYRLGTAELPGGGSSRVEPWDDSALADVERCYRAFGERQQGLVDRSRPWWAERILDPYLDRPTYRFLVRDGGLVSGYIVYGHESGGDLPYSSVLSAIDLVWNSKHAAQALLGFAAQQGPLSAGLTFAGGVQDPITAVIDARPLQGWSFPWMLRVLDVERAISSRGYPPGVEGAAAITVRDPACAGNDGAWRLTFAGGRAAVERATSAALTIDIRGLAALYSSWLPARDLVLLGLLEGATAEELDLVDSAFRGPAPWMVEVV